MAGYALMLKETLSERYYSIQDCRAANTILCGATMEHPLSMRRNQPIRQPSLVIITVVATNNNTGCISPAVSAMVEQTDVPADFIMTLSNSFTENASLTVTVQGGTGPFQFQMDDSTVQDSNVFVNPPPGLHHIRLTDIYGCTDIIKDIAVMEYPKFFTPNGDGYFDKWEIHYLDQQPEATIRIYDRYGKFIKQLSPKGEGWDGNRNGKTITGDRLLVYRGLSDYKPFGRFGLGTI